MLAAWDRKAQAESRGAVLFTYWLQMLLGGGKSPFAVEWRIDSALTTPHTLADKRAAVAALEAAATAVEKRHGALDVPWGEVMRIRYAGKDEPGNGASGDPQGVFRVSMFVPAKDGKFQLVHGDTYYAAVEFGPTVRAKVLLSYGNSTQPGSPHMGDQIPLYVKQQMRDAWLTKADVDSESGKERGSEVRIDCRMPIADCRFQRGRRKGPMSFTGFSTPLQSAFGNRQSADCSLTSAQSQVDRYRKAPPRFAKPAKSRRLLRESGQRCPCPLPRSRSGSGGLA